MDECFRLVELKVFRAVVGENLFRAGRQPGLHDFRRPQKSNPCAISSVESRMSGRDSHVCPFIGGPMSLYVLRLRDGNCIVVDAPDEAKARDRVRPMAASEVATARKLDSFVAQFALTDDG